MQILIAEDEAVSRRMLAHFLANWGYEVVEARDGEEAWEKLQQENAPKLAILDWMMPGIDGIEVCRRLRAAERPYTYVLLLTARQERQDVLFGLDSGADDYLTKPVDVAQLRARLGVGKRIIDLQQRLIEAYEAKRFEATHDSLTGLWNRAAVLGFLEGELTRSERDNTNVAVVIADIDFFKQVNDTYGHLAGDAVLREVARRLDAGVRTYEWAGRYGGEEFLVVASRCTPEETGGLAERLRLRVSSEPVLWGGQEINVSTSLGVATTDQLGELNGDALLKAADSALYLAKRNGRNRVEVYIPAAISTVENDRGKTL
jgi:diguanylate cyclase (GGDEF)-like protein